MIEVKIEGLDELRKALMALPKELHAGPLQRSVSAAARVIQKQARQNVPVLFEKGSYTGVNKVNVLKRRKPGTLRKAIRVGKSRMGSSDVQKMYNVFVKPVSKGVRRNFKGPGRNNPDDPYYWKVWEFGNQVNNSRPFLRPAFDRKKDEALRVMVDKLRKEIDKAGKKKKIR